MKKLDIIAVFGIAICIGVIAGLIAGSMRIGHLQKMYDAANVARHATQSTPTTAAKLAAKQQEARRQTFVREQTEIRLGTVKQGEGIETSFIRQLIADPSLCDTGKVCPPFSGNRDNPTALKQWADNAAHVLACKAGYADCKYGAADIRVAAPNTMSYVIQKTASGIKIAEYRTAPSPVTFSASGEQLDATATAQIGTQIATMTIGASQFLGLPNIINQLPNYEYRHIG